MFCLPFPSEEGLDEYYGLVEPSIKHALEQSALNVYVRNYLDDPNVKKIITDSPDKLLEYHEVVMNALIQNFDADEFETYRRIKNKKAKTALEQSLVDKYSPVKELEKVFNYGKFISGSKPLSYKFARRLGRETCTYCNRLYAQTIIVRDKKTKRVNNTGRITRPDFDHWFPKSKYPLLSLSFFNLIPSCGVCNGSIKGDTELKLEAHIHPYIHENGQEFHFSYNLQQMHTNNVKINCIKDSKVYNTIKAFKIQEVYDAHSDLELKDLLEMRYKYSENYLDTLLNKTFKPLDMSKKEAYRLAFGVEGDEADFHKRPFSKFKKDILHELGIKI